VLKRAWLVHDETSCDIVMWSFIISSSLVFHATEATLIMAPPKGKEVKKPVEARAKMIWYLLVDHEGKLSFGNLANLAVQLDITVAALKEIIKEKKPNDLHPFDANKLEAWTYKHKDFSSDPSFAKLQEIVGRIKFLKASKNLKCLLSSKQKMSNINFPEDVILLVRVPPPQTADTAGGGNGESFIRLAPTQHV